MHSIAHNIRRLMARNGMTLRELVAHSGLHERTVKLALSGNGKPHARTLHRLAAGLGVSTDELFYVPRTNDCSFDQETNPVVQEVVESRPHLFADWTAAEFEELFSHFGTGGALSAEGTLEVAAAINEKRAVHRKVALLLESGESQLLMELVDVLYRKIVITEL